RRAPGAPLRRRHRRRGLTLLTRSGIRLPTPPEIVGETLAAIAAGDWEAVRPRLHPYLHWERADGAVVRGRTTVLALLHERPPTAQPTSVELRDGQIYRWRA